MFKYSWSELITTTLLNRLSALSGTNLVANHAAVSDALVSTFRSTGGLPVADTEYDEAEKTELATRLLSDAMDRYASRLDLPSSAPGHYLVEATNAAFDQEIVAVRKTNLNAATASELEALPTIGRDLARRVVFERTANGAYQSLEDLGQRISGIGEGAVNILRDAVTAGPPTPDALQWPVQADLDIRFNACLALFSGGNPLNDVARLLGSVASTAAAAPHPVTVDKQLRTDGAAANLATNAVDWVGVLANHDYFRRLPDLLKQAAASIKMAMFHAAFTDEDHPSAKLLEELVAARQRGVSVQVLLDQDRESDLYKSTVVNSAAKDYLLAHDVDCRFDTQATLLHSKFIVIDEQTCVLGSHNWSAGSYFQFDDLSLVVRSAAMGQRLAARFDELWPA